VSKQNNATNVEYVLRDGITIISHTDLQGRITDCNEDFVESSGYAREELIGSAHNIVRHPDMPAAAFEDLWTTVKRGRAWSGIVKNCRKDGCHYWVKANVTPLPDGSGYFSVRCKAKPEEVRATVALYSKLNKGEKIVLHEGRVKTFHLLSLLSRLSIAQRLWVMVALPIVLATTLVAAGLWALHESKNAIQDIYEGVTVPLSFMSKINDYNQMSLIDLTLAAQAKGLKKDPSARLADIIQNKAGIDEAWNEVMASVKDEAERKLAADHLAKRQALWQFIGRVAQLINAGDLERVNAMLNEELDSIRTLQEESIDKLMDYQIVSAKHDFDTARRNYDGSVRLSLILGIAGTLLVLIIAVGILRYITRSLGEISDVAKAMAHGDLTRPIPAAADDEIGQMSSALAIVRNSQHELIAAMRSNAEAMHQNASALLESAETASKTSLAQSDAVASMAASVEELSVSIDMVEGNVTDAHTATQHSVKVSAEGGHIIHEAAREMGEIAHAVNATAGSIKELETLSHQISSIVSTIRDISDQTNLLALNAAIEAARAGELGRGFAVVADEVRNLAERTGLATQEISDMITRIQNSTQKAVQDMEAGVTTANAGVELAHQAGDSVEGIHSEAEKVTTAVDIISHALKEQSIATRDIAQRVERIAQGAESNSVTAAQTAESAKHLELMVQRQNALIAGFKVA
jgi:PAS domain S-box-containing protein